jgi:hypothetical protein
MSQRRADESAIHGHLGHARREVMSILVLVVRDPAGKELLEAGQSTGRQHLGAHRVGLELLEVRLLTRLISDAVPSSSPTRHA